MSPKDFLPDNFGSLSGEVPQHELRLQLQALAESKLYLAGRMMFQDDVLLQTHEASFGVQCCWYQPIRAYVQEADQRFCPDIIGRFRWLYRLRRIYIMLLQIVVNDS